ncbi:hypothetical protein GCM10028796_52180 [Ramlibacter monticola]|uniref:Uncharacterized protein n=1 Tax=Ramlibacter monticola TaxID=1926872 RepID=A0A936Z1I2_9BURK|nr:hypothetical protein [Ramlibacter monticola]MBL0392036.1 hypothetical protein [Ramlibacter monticola]
MGTIVPSQRLAAAVRAQLAPLQERAAARPGIGAPAEGTRRKPHEVSVAMARRIAALAPEDPDRPRKAVRIYLEAELAREFGAGLLNDPQFPALLDAVQERMQEDAQTAGAVAALARLLLAGKPRAA